MSPITRIKVGRGFTKRPSEGEELWERRYFEIEAEVGPSEVPDQVKDYLEMKLVEWLEQVPIEEVKAIPELDIAALPWKKKDKTPASPDDWGWILGPASTQGPPEGAEPLVALLDQHEGKVELPPYEFTYSKDKVFIQRRPLKKEA